LPAGISQVASAAIIITKKRMVIGVGSFLFICTGMVYIWLKLRK
jgi:hypothetical protein